MKLDFLFVLFLNFIFLFKTKRITKNKDFGGFLTSAFSFGKKLLAGYEAVNKIINNENQPPSEKKDEKTDEPKEFNLMNLIKPSNKNNVDLTNVLSKALKKK